MYALAECNNTVSFIWPDDGSIEPKHVAEFLILITNIQGDSGGICITLGNDSMSDSKQ